MQQSSQEIQIEWIQRLMASLMPIQIALVFEKVTKKQTKKHFCQKNNGYFWKFMLQHTKPQVKLFEMHCFKMFLTAVGVIFVMKLRWSKKKNLKDTLHRLTIKQSWLLQVTGQKKRCALEQNSSYVGFVWRSNMAAVSFDKKMVWTQE